MEEVGEVTVTATNEGGPSEEVKNGYMLFRREFLKGGEKFKNMSEQAKKASKAWKQLTPEEQKKYSDRVKQSRKEGMKKKRKKKVAFSTRCSVRQFKSLVDFIKDDEDLKVRVQNLGFGHLLDIGCERLPRDLIVCVLRAYDPPTHQFLIRGIIKEIEANDVANLLGVPHTGEKVKMDVCDDDETYQRLKEEFGKVPYTKILNDIKSGQKKDEFEFLFMLYTLGSFLTPTSQTTVSDKLIRVMCCTMKGFHQFDWATYIVKHLWKEMGDYVKVYTKAKKDEDEDEGSCNVGGCIYLLLRGSLNAIQFWTDERIRKLEKKERESKRGLLYKGKGSMDRSGKDEGKRRSVAHLHPELQKLHGRLMAQIELSTMRLISAMEDELDKVQIRIEENNVTTDDEDPIDVPDDDKGDDDAFGDEDSHDHDGHESDDEGDDRDEFHGGDGQGDDDATGSDRGDDIGVAAEGADKEIMESPLPLSPMDKGCQLRRSQREMKSAINSPWILTKPTKRRKRPMDDKDRFYDIVSRMCSSKEGDMPLVKISDEDITRDQLRTLGGIEKIGNRLMSTVCKTLMADMEKEGQVKRHIFYADFMAIMAANPKLWDATKRKKQFLPENVGYNIGECDLIFGPTLVGAHWFCVVLEPSTMNFYVLDSMKPNLEGKKKSKKKGVIIDDMTTVVTECRNRFYDIIEIVKPNATGKKKMSDIIWAPVPQQNNLRDCGVHVLIWLSKWKPGEILHYTDEQVAEFRRNLMWWLVNHELNSRRDEALSLLSSTQATTLTKRRHL
ncbi:uncharacterized protein LOC114756887 isoform X2 [Neltuma alba]|uniref:uncharacterized protein LOC114711792 isoform X2 n=1 Tax=Neltuma alba TaxID=207710 RepID=UPI0010A2B211|nr:uncharacterized protein LOC114711792 isoform X2 [Prosopis alba]XP_028782915.1 uncharacterized protein LOC114739018 isoform X2 [Prosopis alba]XP_028795505.1 uncharacterized protein LOC114751001 isoform X2 [Prosopis alba]XP_028801669.1 uncharacterized protein LOC114756887 isoform X2 [Prosopis alba]